MGGAVKIYHNPRCGKSRRTLQLLQAHGIEPEIVEYLKTPPTVDELDNLLKMLKLEPIELMRKKESVFQELGIDQREYNREELLTLMVEHPILIERPIVVKGKKAIIGRPPETVLQLL